MMQRGTRAFSWVLPCLASLYRADDEILEGVFLDDFH